MEFTKIQGNVEARQFPDDGPTQGDVSAWIKDNGVEASLYDGNVRQNIKTSTDANWHWTSMSIEGIYEWVKIGAWIVKDLDGEFRVFSQDQFDKLFTKVN